MTRNALPLILLVTIRLSSAAEAIKYRPAGKARSELIPLVQGGDCVEGVVHGADVNVSSGAGQEQNQQRNRETGSGILTFKFLIYQDLTLMSPPRRGPR